MSDISITLSQSAISLVGFFSAGVCYLWVSRFGPKRGYLRKRCWRSSQQKLSESQIS